MKNTISFIALLLFSISLISCEKEETKTSNEKIIDGITVDLTASKLGDNVSLMSYSNVQELHDKLPEVISNLLEDIKSEMSGDTLISDTFVNLKFENGKAIISEIVFFDNVSKSVISGFILNYNTMKYESISASTQSWISLAGGCPSGYSSLGTCSNFSSPKECITKKLSNFLAVNISGVGDCENVQVSVGSLATTVCGKTC